MLNLIEGFLRLYNFNIRLRLKEFAYMLKYVHNMLYKPRSLLRWTIIPLRGRSWLIHRHELLWDESWELLVFWKTEISTVTSKFILWDCMVWINSFLMLRLLVIFVEWRGYAYSCWTEISIWSKGPFRLIYF